jgi:glycosyltransferase involved in cell wall biosynthesis
MRVPISFIIPTRNEERNIRRAIESVVDWADEVFVLDSYSNDRTVELAKAMGVHVAQRRFDNFAAQKNWALDHLPIGNEWVFFLDADERVPGELRTEITEAISGHGCGWDGYFVGMKQLFMGSVIAHGGWSPNLRLLLFKHRLGRYEERMVHEHLTLRGRVGRLKNFLIHEDRKGIHQYFERHNVYSTMEALEAHRYLTEKIKHGSLSHTLLGGAPGRRRALKQWAYRHLPCRPLFKFLWSYGAKLGFLDGAIGFRYCLLQSLYEYQVSLKLIELRSDPTSPMLRYGLSLPLKGAEGGVSRSDCIAESRSPEIGNPVRT